METNNFPSYVDNVQTCGHGHSIAPIGTGYIKGCPVCKRKMNELKITPQSKSWGTIKEDKTKS